MKAILPFLFFLTSLSAVAGNPSGCPVMSKGAEAALKPVLKELAAVRKSGNWFAPRYEAVLTKLLRSKERDAVEARVALMDYYTGEHTGEELVCVVARDGAAVKALLQLYSRCDIAPSQSPAARDRSLPLRGYALDLLKQGNVEQSCTHD